MVSDGQTAYYNDAHFLRASEVVSFRHDEKELTLLVPPAVYRPDAWTSTLLAGVDEVLATRPCEVLVEVGVGTGVVPALLGQLPAEEGCPLYVGLDISALACETARLNVKLSRARVNAAFITGGHLLEFLPSELAQQTDVLAANVPQMPLPDTESQNLNDYYEAQARDDPTLDWLEHSGLGLVYELLRQARNALRPGTIVVTTLAGRCGAPAIRALFESLEMSHRLGYTVRVQQDPATRLDALAASEHGLGAQCEFFLTPGSSVSVGVREALEAVASGRAAYYDLHAAIVKVPACSAGG